MLNLINSSNQCKIKYDDIKNQLNFARKEYFGLPENDI